MFENLIDYGTSLVNFFNGIYRKYFIERRAWLTLLSNDEYLIGVLALARSLKRAKTIYPFVVMIIEDNVSKETQEQLINEGCIIKPIKGLNTKQDPLTFAFQRFIFVWSKLRAFEMTDVADKCVFLDSDTIVLQNADELFQLDDNPDFAAVQTCICNPAKNPNYPSYWTPSNCPHTSGNSSTINEQCRIFNSGMFLFHPNKKIFQEMLKCLNMWNLDEFPFADQCFLNKFFENKWKCLPSIYNSLKTFSLTHPNIWDTSKIKIIHYILAKPWETKDSSNQLYEKVNQLWWDAYQYKSN